MNAHIHHHLLAELQEFRRRCPSIDHLYALLCDNNGVLRGKRLSLNELDEFFRHGRGVASSMLWLDITGKDISHYDLVWQDGDSDRLCLPVPGTLTPAPWLGERYGQVLMTMFEPDGAPTPQDPRQVLAHVLQHFHTMQLRPVVAAELEFYLVECERTPDGRVQPPKSPRTGERAQFIRGYEANEMEDFQSFLTDVHDTALAMGIPAETVISEYGPSQFEVTLHHQDDALRAMDQAVLFKRLVKGVALKHGFIATFMAKPYAREAGSGLHVHMSLIDEAGNNVFADTAADHDAGYGSPLLRHAIGGLAQHMAESMLLFGPHANSYRRLRAGFYAPVNTAWGINNRTVSLRVPASSPSARRLEHRVAGADANPYLVLAGILAAVHAGLTGQLDPGAPAEGDASEQALGALPAHWMDAIDVFEASEFIARYFPAGFIETYVATKRAEMWEFFGEVSPLDYDWYLRTV